MRLRRSAWLILIPTLLALSTARGASPVGALSGRVTDEGGAAVAGARITVAGAGAVGRYSALTDATGGYRIPGLPSREPLEVRGETEGRIPVVYSGVEVTAGGETRRDFRLRPQGWHEVLIVLDARIPYHLMALEGARKVLKAGTRVLKLTGSSLRDARSLAEALADRPNAVLAIGREAARLARREVRDVPIVHAMVPDPRADDLIAKNACGVPLNGGWDDQIALLARLRPGARRLLSIYDPRRLSRVVRQLRRAAAARSLELVARPARRVAEVAEILAASRGGGFDAFLLLLDPDLLDAEAFDRVRRFTEEEGMMLVVPDPSLVATGGTFSYAPGFEEIGAHAGRLVEGLFTGGGEPSDVGLSFPSVRSFAYNEHEVRRLGIEIPASWTSGRPR